MATEGTCVLLLVVSLSVVASQFATNRDSGCLGGELNVFKQLGRCTARHIQNLPSVRAIMRIMRIRQPPTKAMLYRIVEDMCTVSLAAGKQCFEESISECDTATQETFNRLMAKGVGYLCQPDGSGLNPAWAALFDSIPAEHITVYFNRFKTRERDCPVNLEDTCHDAMSEEIRDVGNLPFESIASTYQSALDNYFDCSVTKYRAESGNCPTWQLDFVMKVGQGTTFRALPGVRFPYTPQQMLEMFEVQSRSVGVYCLLVVATLLFNGGYSAIT